MSSKLRLQFSSTCEQSQPAHAERRHLLSVVQAATNAECSCTQH